MNFIHDSHLGLSFPLFLSLVRGSGNCTPPLSVTDARGGERCADRTHTYRYVVGVPPGYRPGDVPTGCAPTTGRCRLPGIGRECSFIVCAAEAAELARGGAYKRGNSSTTCLEPNPSLHSMNPSLHSRKCTEPQGGFGGFTSSSSPLLPTRYALPHQPDARAFVFSGSQRWEFFFFLFGVSILLTVASSVSWDILFSPVHSFCQLGTPLAQRLLSTAGPFQQLGR